MQSEAKTQLSAITAWYITDLSLPISPLSLLLYVLVLTVSERICTGVVRTQTFWTGLD